MSSLRIMDDELVFPYLVPGKLSLPNLFPTLFQLLSLTPTFNPYPTDANILIQWQNASSASAYLNLLCFIIPASTSLAAEHRLYLTADTQEADFLLAAVQDTRTRSQLPNAGEMLRHWREARAAFEAKQTDVQRNRETVDAWTRVGDLLVDMAGLLGKAVVVEAESHQNWAMQMSLRHDLGQARGRLEALRTEIVEVAGRVEVICGEMRERSDARAASLRRAIEQTRREKENETQRMIDEVLRRSKEGEELGVGPLQQSIKKEEDE